VVVGWLGRVVRLGRVNGSRRWRRGVDKGWLIGDERVLRT
jgi:hypothetical protein